MNLIKLELTQRQVNLIVYALKDKSISLEKENNKWKNTRLDLESLRKEHDDLGSFLWSATPEPKPYTKF